MRDTDPTIELQSDLHPPLSAHEAAVEADRCYFCYDAPCMTACPTGIDVPLFIRQIQSGNPRGSARTILDENILGGMCARVCPTETLCEQACVRQTAENAPVKIGALQRYSTDVLMADGEHPYQRGAPSGRKVAVVGAGPAGLACAHRLSMYGHAVTVFDANDKPGGLNEYGIAAYKTVDNFAQREVDFVLGIGGIDIKSGTSLGADIKLSDLTEQYDAVFLGIGLSDVNSPDMEGDSLAGVENAVDFIKQLRQTQDYSTLNTGDNVLVIGGGMTATDAAVQSKMLGASEVTIAYRRGAEHMNASTYEQHLAQTHGVVIKHYLQPVRFIDNGSGRVGSVELEQMSLSDGKLTGTGEYTVLQADQVFKAIGQDLQTNPLDGIALELTGNRIVVNADRQTSHANIFAGGDCVADGDDLTVSAVQDGKLAAEAIHRQLT